MPYFFTVKPDVNTGDTPLENELLESVRGILHNVTDDRSAATFPYPVRMCIEIKGSPNFEEDAHGNPLGEKDRFIRNWRSLMIMFALNDIKKYELAILKAGLPRNYNPRKQLQSLIKKNIDMAYNTKILDSRNEVDGWDEIGAVVFKYDQFARPNQHTVLGSTNPLLLVAPNESFLDILEQGNGKVPEIKNEPDLCLIVGKWLRKLMSQTHNPILKEQLEGLESELCKYYTKSKGASDSRVWNSLVKISDSPTVSPIKFDSLIDVPDTTILDNMRAEARKEQDKEDGVKRAKQMEEAEAKIPDETWLEFFTALALKDIRSLSITCNRKGDISFDGFELVKEPKEKHTTMYSLANFQKGTYAPAKSKFELICLLNWLDEFERKLNGSIPAIASRIHTARTEVRETLESELSRDVDVDTLKMPSYCFDYFDEKGNPFCLTTHRRNAAFLYDEGDLGEEVRKGWLSTLYLLALQDVRSINLEFIESTSKEGELPDWEGSYKKTPNYKKYNLHHNGVKIASTSSVTLFELEKGFEGHVEKAKQDMDIYEHERLLVAYWLENLIRTLDDELKGDKTSKSKILDLMRNERNKLLDTSTDTVVATKIKNFSNCGFFGSLFTLRDTNASFSGEDSVRKFIDRPVQDNVFEKKLMVFQGDKISDEELSCSTDEHSIYSVFEVQDDGKRSSKPSSDSKILLPFTKEMAFRFENAFNRSSENHLRNSRPFSLQYVKTFASYCDETDSNVYEVVFRSNEEHMKEIEIRKQYDGDNINDCGNPKDMIGNAAIWPANDIGGFSSYKLNYVTTVGTDPVDLISFEDIEDNDVVEYNNLEMGDSLFRKISYKLPKFPKYLRFSHNGTEGTMLCVPDRIIEDTVIADESAIIGIDFGTSNSLMYLKTGNGDAYPFDWSNAEGKMLTLCPVENSTPVAMMFFQVPYPGETSKGAIIPTVYARYKNDTGTEPLLHGNVLFFSMIALKGLIDNIVKSNGVYTDPKWDSETYDSRQIVFKQMLTSAISSIVERIGGRVPSLEVRVSFPTSIPEDSQKAFFESWKHAVDSLKETFEFPTADSLVGPLFFTESYCAGIAYDCYPRNLSYRGGVIVVDVGGGTADIAIVQRENDMYKVRFEASLKFGARRILSGSLLSGSVSGLARALIEVRENLNTVVKGRIADKNLKAALFGEGVQKLQGLDLKKAINERKRIEDEGKEPGTLLTTSLDLAVQSAMKGTSRIGFDRRKAIFDLERALEHYGRAFDQGIGKDDLNRISESLGRELATKKVYQKSDRMDGLDIKSFLKINLACASLFFYLGSLVKALKAHEAYKKFDFDIREIVLAGNGARVIDWIKCEEGSNRHTEYLKAFFSMGMGESASVEVIPSTKRKQEVSTGLILASPTEARSEKNPSVDFKWGHGHDMLKQQDELCRFLKVFHSMTDPSEFDLLFDDIRHDEFYDDDQNPSEKLKSYIESQCKSANDQNNIRDNKSLEEALQESSEHIAWVYAAGILEG